MAFPKMKVFAYSDPQFNDKTGEFTALLNPNTYVQNYKVTYKSEQAPGTTGQQLKFEKIDPQKMEFEFLFDRTGAIPNSTDEGEGIKKDLADFNALVLGFDGSIHRTSYLKLSWGTLLFKCCLSQLAVTYKLFKSDGTPLRAVAKCSFDEFKEDEQRTAQDNTNSPDLTHRRVVKAGETLPLMCHRIYGDSKYYLEVARINDMNDYRRLKAGEQIFFPPLS